jgi:hypothetical protein
MDIAARVRALERMVQLAVPPISTNSVPPLDKIVNCAARSASP